MGATAFAAIGAGTAIYGAVKGSKRQDAPVLPTLPEAPDTQQAAAQATSQAALAAVRQRQRAASAKGNQSTILTGPQGLPNVPAPGKSTLLGL